MTRVRNLLLAVSAMGALAGCFNDDDPAPVIPPMSVTPPDPLVTLPTNLGSSISALLEYQIVLARGDASRADKAEPLDISNLILAVSETAEPADI